MISVKICHLRRKLAPHGIAINHRKNVGWYLGAADKEKLRELREEDH